MSLLDKVLVVMTGVTVIVTMGITFARIVWAVWQKFMKEVKDAG